jgi:hypothetical protein
MGGRTETKTTNVVLSGKTDDNGVAHFDDLI